MTFNTDRQLTNVFFIAATIHGVKNIFSEPGTAGIALSAFALSSSEKKTFLYAYVVMPANVYAILKPRERSIEHILEDFDAQTTRHILNQLKVDSRTLLYQELSTHKNPRGVQSIWQGIHPMKIRTLDILEQRMNFIHNAPLDKQWQLVADRADYRFSSACYYDRNETPIINVDDVKQLY